MEIRFIELDLEWERSIGIADLRQFIISKLNIHGTPLRWSMTSIDELSSSSFPRIIRIEATVIIIPDSEQTNLDKDLK